MGRQTGGIIPNFGEKSTKMTEELPASFVLIQGFHFLIIVYERISWQCLAPRLDGDGTNKFGSLAAFSILCAAISKYDWSISMPIKFLPNCFATTPVVPEPIKGSRIMPPCLAAHLIQTLREPTLIHKRLLQFPDLSSQKETGLINQTDKRISCRFCISCPN